MNRFTWSIEIFLCDCHGEIEDETLILQLTLIKDNELEDIENLSLEDIQSIQKGMKQCKNGQTTPYKEIMKSYENYL